MVVYLLSLHLFPANRNGTFQRPSENKRRLVVITDLVLGGDLQGPAFQARSHGMAVVLRELPSKVKDV